MSERKTASALNKNQSCIVFLSVTVTSHVRETIFFFFAKNVAMSEMGCICLIAHDVHLCMLPSHRGVCTKATSKKRAKSHNLKHSADLLWHTD